MLNVGNFFLMILSTYRQKLMESSSHFGIALQTSIFCMNNQGFFFFYTHFNCIVAYYNTFYSSKNKTKRSLI